MWFSFNVHSIFLNYPFFIVFSAFLSLFISTVSIFFFFAFLCFLSFHFLNYFSPWFSYFLSLFILPFSITLSSLFFSGFLSLFISSFSSYFSYFCFPFSLCSFPLFKILPSFCASFVLYSLFRLHLSVSSFLISLRLSLSRLSPLVYCISLSSLNSFLLLSVVYKQFLSHFSVSDGHITAPWTHAPLLTRQIIWPVSLLIWNRRYKLTEQRVGSWQCLVPISLPGLGMRPCDLQDRFLHLAWLLWVSTVAAADTFSWTKSCTL